MAKFSKDMFALCRKTLKFLTPVCEKFAKTNYVMPIAEQDELERHIREIVQFFMQSSTSTRQKYRSIADDVDGLYRLGELIRNYREGTIQLDMLTLVNDVRKRVTAINALLDCRELRRKKLGGSGCFLYLVILGILLGIGWHFRHVIIDKAEENGVLQPSVMQPSSTPTENQTSEGEND